MRFHELGLDPFDLVLQLRLLLSVKRKQITRKLGYGLHCRYAIEQRLDMAHPRCCGDTEFRSKAPDRIGKLRAL